MIEPTRVDASSTIDLLSRIESRNPHLSRIVVFTDNAAYHKARAVAEWLARPERRVELRFLPVYCPHLNPIERLWGEMHRRVTHNRRHPSQRDFCDAALKLLTETVPRHFERFRDRVTDNFRVIDPAKYRILA